MKQNDLMKSLYTNIVVIKIALSTPCIHSLSLTLHSHTSLHSHISRVVSALGYVVNLLFSVLTRFDLRAVNLESLHSWHVYTSGTLFLRIFAHEKWIQVSHSEHSIIGRPAYGFIQKQVINSDSSSGKSKNKMLFAKKFQLDFLSIFSAS